MRRLVGVLSLAAAASAAVDPRTEYAADPARFRAWADEFGWAWDTPEEEARRYALWSARVEAHGRRSLGPHSALTAHEEGMRRAAAVNATLRAGSAGYKWPGKFSDAFVKEALAAGVDWKAKGMVPGAKNQGKYGYCGTFGRTQVAESQWAIHGHPLVSLSEQQLGACGGWMSAAGQFQYLYANGLESYDDYPYDGSNTCKENRAKAVFGGGIFTDNIVMPNSYGEDQLAAFLYKNGPVDMGIDSSILYKTDEDHFITADKCTSDMHSIDHSQTLVGFGVDPKKGAYWHLKNSWGTNFGDKGFVKIARGKNCGGIPSNPEMIAYGSAAKYFDV